ncbi:MAG TPA: hypothetical protein VIK52_06625, partial [Opitutaceae bacterium]
MTLVKNFLPVRSCLLAFLLSPVAAFCAPPANDNFADAIVIGPAGGTVAGTNVDATKEPGEPNHHGNLLGKSVWWTWTAPGASSVNIETAGSD